VRLSSWNLRCFSGLWRQTWRRLTLQKLDGIGTVLFTGATSCIFVALQWGGVKYGWFSGRIVLLLFAFALTGIGWIFISIDEAKMPPCLAVSSRCARLPPAPYTRSSWVPPSTSSSTMSQCGSKPSMGGRLVVRPILATNDPWAVYRDVARGPELAICGLCSTIYDHFDHCGVGKLRSTLDLDTAHFKSCEGLEDRAFRTRTEA